MSQNVESRGTLAARSAQASREVLRDSDLRRARTCYDHLAGVAGVDLLEEMLSWGWFRVEEGTKPSYHLTSDGQRALLGLGVDLPTAAAQRRPFAYGCLDWTERRYHLRGSLSAAILTALSNSGTVVRTAGTRTVALKRPMVEWLQS